VQQQTGIAKIKELATAYRDYGKKGGKRSYVSEEYPQGIPEECVYDLFAYARIVETYREGFQRILDMLPEEAK